MFLNFTKHSSSVRDPVELLDVFQLYETFKVSTKHRGCYEKIDILKQALFST